MFWAYVIKSDLNKIYIGHTSNLENRIKRHNGLLPVKKSSYTYKNGSNWRIIHKEEFDTRDEAIKREKELKSFKGRKFIKSLL